MGILQGINRTNVDKFTVILDQSPEYPEYSGHVGTLIVANANDTDQSISLTFKINTTNDDQPPRNVVIYIEGCISTTVRTKAQIEQIVTSSKSGLFIMKTVHSLSVL